MRLEPGRGKVLARIAFGFGSVWVTDSASGSLYRIAPGPEPALECSPPPYLERRLARR
ncbi:MAG TPA: hypothetical protein VGC06_08550 [Actinomycetes bacterium]